MKNISLNEQIIEFIAQKEASGALPPGAGIAVCVLKDGDVLFNGSYGLRGRDQLLPVTPETVFEICSATKAFTATALLMASEEGKVDLDRPINASKNLIPLKDAEASKKVSIADILSHRTGLPSNDLLWYFGHTKREELRHAIAHLDMLSGGFRQTFIYNNLLYGTLGHLFDELVGESWESYITRKILSPLKMTNTSFTKECVGKCSEAEKNVALPYVGTQRVKNADLTTIAAAGAMRSSLEDMTRWMAFYLNGGQTLNGERLLSEASIDLMLSNQIPVETSTNPLIFQGLEWLGKKVNYGLGWFLGSTRGLKAAYHPGFIDGFSAALVMIPEKKLGFITLMNLNLSPIPGLLIQNLLDTMENKFNPQKQFLVPTKNKSLAVTGRYQSPAFGSISVELLSEDRLIINYNGNRWPLTWKTDNIADFAVDAFGIQLPLSVEFKTTDGKFNQLSIPFSLDPRVGPQVFTRAY
jgi:CubicO group peptidase (beta-lactamase class C family)